MTITIMLSLHFSEHSRDIVMEHATVQRLTDEEQICAAQYVKVIALENVFEMLCHWYVVSLPMYFSKVNITTKYLDKNIFAKLPSHCSEIDGFSLVFVSVSQDFFFFSNSFSMDYSRNEVFVTLYLFLLIWLVPHVDVCKS